MSMVMEEEVKRWTAKRKAALVTEIIQGKTTVAEASRAFDMPPSEIDEWVDEAKRGMENALRAKPLDVRERMSARSKSCRKHTVKRCLNCVPEKVGVPAGRGREVIETIRQGLAEDGFKVSINKLCQWFDMPRRTVYYKSVKAAPKVQPRFAEPIKAMINEEPSFGYRTVAALLGFNNTVQRIFQLRGWQVKKRPIGFGSRVQALPSVATAPNQRWATDLCRVWGGRDGWLVLALVIDCHTRELLGWHLSRSGKAKTAEAALEQALIAR